MSDVSGEISLITSHTWHDIHLRCPFCVSGCSMVWRSSIRVGYVHRSKSWWWYTLTLACQGLPLGLALACVGCHRSVTHYLLVR